MSLGSPYTFCGTCLLVVYELLYLLAGTCHIRAVFGDPGTTGCLIAKDPPEGFSSPRICKPCGFRWKPPRAHHCRKCQLCVFRMDHHCAWIDNCVGILNQKFFILFLVYSAALCGYQLSLIVLTIIMWIWAATFTVSIVKVCLGAAVLVESLIFLYMTTDFFSEQLDALETNSTLVESHQHTHGTQKEFWSNVADVFGNDRTWWLFPIHPKLQLDFTEPVFLDKAVAVQLRSRQKRHGRHRPEGTASPGGTAMTAGTGTAASAASATTLRSSPSADAVSGLRQRRPHHHTPSAASSMSPMPEDPLHPPLGLVEPSDRWPHVTGQHRPSPPAPHVSAEAFDPDTSTHGDESSDEAQYEEQQFKNVYMRPWTDIGVELDDESRFVRLEDLEDDDELNSSSDWSDDDGNVVVIPPNSCHDAASCSQR